MSINYNNTMFGNATLVCNIDEYENICKTVGCYEGIPRDKKIKVYGDIDYWREIDNEDGEQYDATLTETFINIAKDTIDSLIHELNPSIIPEYCVCTSSSESFNDHKTHKLKWKISVHIIVTNVISNLSNIEYFFKKANEYAKENKANYYGDYVENMTEFFDMSVYKTNQKMRSPYCSKPHENRPLVIIEGTFEDSIISACFKDDAFQLPQLFVPPVEIPNLNKSYTLYDKSFNDDYTFIQLCIENKMFSKLSNEYKSWICMGYAIKNTLGDKGEPLFHNFSRLSPKYEEDQAKETYSSINQKLIPDEGNKKPKVLTIASIKKWAKDENPTLYKNILDSIRKKPVSQKKQVINITDYDIMLEFMKYCDDNSIVFKCTNIKLNEWIILNKEIIWENDVDSKGVYIYKIIGNEFCTHKMNYLKDLQVLEQDEHNKIPVVDKIQLLKKQIQYLKSGSSKHSLMTEIQKEVYDGVFMKDMNLMIGHIPLKNKKMLNLNTLQLTERTKQDKFNYMCPVSYTPIIQDSIEYTFSHTYFSNLFSNDMDTLQVFLDVIKTSIAGYRLKNLFLLTGSKGNNGKSTLFEILNCMFGKMIDTISKKVIIENKFNGSTINTELEKLPNIRIGYINELKEEDIFNIDVIKQIIGGDPMNLRALNKTDVTIKPTCNLFGLTNKNGGFNNDPLFAKRVIIFPFNNEFANDSSFKNKMIDKIDILFTYIMQYGKIIQNVVMSAEMTMAHNEYMEMNTIDYLQDFIEDKYEMSPDKKVLTNQFYTSFVKWCAEHKFKHSFNTITKMTRAITKKGIKCESDGKVRCYYGLTRKDIPELDEESLLH